MSLRNTRSLGRSTGPRDYDGLLDCRMEMLGLDVAAARRADQVAFSEIQDACVTCGFREACAVDLERDPNNPVWETYCPCAGTLIDLATRDSAAV